MERCVSRFSLQNPSMVFGSHGVSNQASKARIFSTSFGVDLPKVGLKQKQLRRGIGCILPFRQKKSNDNVSLGFGRITCTSDAQQIAEVENSVEGTSSHPTQSLPVNCHTEKGLELVNCFEGGGSEALEESLRREPASGKQSRDEREGPSWIGSGTSLPDIVQEAELSYHGKGRMENGVILEKSYSGGDDCMQSLKRRNEESVGSNLDVEVKDIWRQMKDIILFAGPALGIWLSAPVMSLIDTAVIGNISSMELAALGPGTVMCDQLYYIFTFLSVATSNLIATSLANKDKASAEKHLSRLLLIAMACGTGMFLLIESFGTLMLKAFVGANNYALVPAARTYVEIRAYAWPVALVGMVAQSASLGMQDSWGPLKVLAIAFLIKCLGDVFLCIFLRCGIAGAAWATTASQVIGALLMLRSLHHKGYNSLAVVIPSIGELVQIFQLAGPVFLAMMSKMAFYTVITYLAASLGAITLAAHQVMIGVYSMCTVSGEPLAQAAQSFMPDLIYGVNRNMRKAQKLLRSLVVIGTIFGLSVGFIAVTMPWFFPEAFTRDVAIIKQMRGVTLPFFLSMIITPPTLSLEGTLLATRDLKYFCFSLLSCFCGGSVLLLVLNNFGFGLEGSWWTLVAFQWARFALAFAKLASPKSVMIDEAKWSETKMQLKIA